MNDEKMRVENHPHNGKATIEHPIDKIDAHEVYEWAKDKVDGVYTDPTNYTQARVSKKENGISVTLWIGYRQREFFFSNVENTTSV